MALAKFALIYFSLPFLSTHYQTIICSAQIVTKKNESAHFQYFTTPYLQVGLIYSLLLRLLSPHWLWPRGCRLLAGRRKFRVRFSASVPFSRASTALCGLLF